MSTKLRPNSKLVREIQVRGVESPVIVTLTHEGLEMRVQGTRMSVFAPWHRVAAAAGTPGNVPSYLEGKALEFLKYQAQKQAQNREPRP